LLVASGFGQTERICLEEEEEDEEEVLRDQTQQEEGQVAGILR
jgi:hypothetical protein